MATKSQLESLKRALSFDRPPLCSGAVSPSPEGFYLYYDKKNPKFIDFASTTPENLDLLTAACDPATFGRGNEDIHDESYRKAVKMDASGFAVQLDLVGSGVMGALEDQLLERKTEKKHIRAELYKLDVYEKGSFFKAHKDTARGTDMLGSLVILYPTVHEGGELVLRHEGHEWKFDANSLTRSQSSPSLAYVAFYSDIEHEVLKVTSGRRIAVTYNLYLVDPLLGPEAPGVAPKRVSNLQITLERFLKSPEFLSHGGTLGFGLAHLYPVTFETELQEMMSYLKGKDAHVYRAFRELQFQPSLQMIYYDERYNPRLNRCIMLDNIVQNPSYDYKYDSYWDALRELGGVWVNPTEDTVFDRSRRAAGEFEFITWISPFNERNRLRDLYLAYEDDVSTGHAYCSPCLIVRIPPACDRV